MKLLHIDSSILGDRSVSRQLSREVVDAIQTASPSLQLVYRDLSTNFGLQVDHALMSARALPPAMRNASQLAMIDKADAVLAEFVSADMVVIGMPMYNFGIPSQLKSWVDLIAVAGVTFRYGPRGPEGMTEGKRVVLVATAGGKHAGQPSGLAHVDYMRGLLGFLGVRDIRVISAEGLAMGPVMRDAALAGARANISHTANQAQSD